MTENLEVLRNLIIKHHNIDVKVKKRDRYIVDLKKIFCLIAYNQIKDFNYTKVGKFLLLNHATIIHHVKSAKHLLEYDFDFKQKYNNTEENFFMISKDVMVQQVESEIYLCEKRIEYLKKTKKLYFRKIKNNRK